MHRTRGLPTAKKMRHDAHFVERLAARPSEKVGEQIPVDRIDPNPNQPRRRMEGIAELVASIQEKGVLEPILIREMGDRYQIIAGERRFRAAQQAGLTKVPCITLDVDDRGCLEISLVENLQRRDLTPFDEADGLAQLKNEFGYTHEQIGRKLGRSRSAISEMLSLATMPAAVRKKCMTAGLRARSALVQIARLPDEDQMHRLVDAASRHELSRDDLRAMLRVQTDTPRPAAADTEPRPRKGTGHGYLFRYRDPHRRYSFNLRFSGRDQIERQELILVLESIIADLRTQS